MPPKPVALRAVRPNAGFEEAYAKKLCRLIDDPATRLSAPLFLLDAHIDGVKAAVKSDIRDVEHPVGKALVEELERRVKAMGA